MRPYAICQEWLDKQGAKTDEYFKIIFSATAERNWALSHDGGFSSLVEGFSNCYFHSAVVENNKNLF